MSLLVNVYGLKQAKREPWIDDKGEIIDDGINRPISLYSNAPEEIAEFFMSNLKAQYHGKSWKFWIEPVK